VISENWIYLGTAIGAAGAAVYLRDTLRGTTQPNRVTWLLWAVAPLLAAAVEFNEGVGLRALPTFMVGFMPLLIFIGSFHNSASVWKVRRMDYACGAVSVIGTVVWLVTRDGVLAIFVACVASVESVLIGLELGPRFRRSRDPGAGSAAPAEGMTR